MENYIIQTIDEVKYKLKSKTDFSWLHKYGEVFSCIDETGSGCICFGVQNKNQKLFFKIAGVDTVEREISFEESKKLLKDSIQIYNDLRHDSLIKLIDSFDYEDYFVAIFEYAQGECLFDHWNFEYYKQNNIVETPIYRFKHLCIEKRTDVVKKLFSFFKHFVAQGYVAVDFYDSSIIYDFVNDKATFCDVDLFRKVPTFNDLGEDYFGTKRLKAPEETILGEPIDEKTSEFTLAALIFDFFSRKIDKSIRYEKGMFVPNGFEDFELSKETYDVLLKATSYDRNKRYNSIDEFEAEFFKSLSKQ